MNRRGFLKLVAATPAAAVIPKIPLPPIAAAGAAITATEIAMRMTPTIGEYMAASYYRQAGERMRLVREMIAYGVLTAGQ